MNDKHLDYFGEFLIRKVRDMSIDHMDRIITGKMKGVTGRALYEKIVASNVNEAILQEVVWKAIDVTLHQFLLGFEEEHALDVSVKLDDEKKNIKDLSDGFPGELYTEDGWIERFSDKPYIDYSKDMS